MTSWRSGHPSPVADGEVLALSQDMTISRDEFLRSLPAAIGHAAFRIDSGAIRPLDSRHNWRIAIAPLADLRIGMLALPRLHVEIFLADCGADETAHFLERFELYFRRAGG